MTQVVEHFIMHPLVGTTIVFFAAWVIILIDYKLDFSGKIIRRIKK
jgi:hypothetical protein